MYIKFTDYNGQLTDGDILLMSHDDFVNGGKLIMGVPICVTPDGDEPKEVDDENGLVNVPDNL